MRRVPVTALHAGMKIARPVYSAGGQMLLSAGLELTERYIERLGKLGINFVYVEDGLLPDLEVDDVISDETRSRARSLMRELLQSSTGKRVDIKRCLLLSKEIQSVVENIVDELLGNKNLIFDMMDIRTHDDYTFAHSVNVGVLAVMAGLAMKMPRERLLQLGKGAMLHDIGKIDLPLSILNKPGKLTEDEFDQIKKHCQVGMQILKHSGYVNIVEAAVALQHHERYDGSGYPGGLRGEQIHLFSRITSIADVYDAITSNRVYRPAFPPHEAYELLAAGGGSMFDYEIVRIFIEIIAPYPLGTIVELSNGEIAAVVENIPGFNLYPRVRVLFDPYGQEVGEMKEYFLARQRDIVIHKVIDDVFKYVKERSAQKKSG
ncbi:HD-GYP domain-containing protein [Desulfurispora thermophila]|uniref:HD-GYP domain-containing protein n=1 Tax=Desulfurispora thermophila TaxID=265470 RepID=UPI0004761456|nr:HD-GYP domain-containing protein [Desulfurispora thermophila]